MVVWQGPLRKQDTPGILHMFVWSGLKHRQLFHYDQVVKKTSICYCLSCEYIRNSRKIGRSSVLLELSKNSSNFLPEFRHFLVGWSALFYWKPISGFFERFPSKHPKHSPLFRNFLNLWSIGMRPTLRSTFAKVWLTPLFKHLASVLLIKVQYWSVFLFKNWLCTYCNAEVSKNIFLGNFTRIPALLFLKKVFVF